MTCYNITFVTSLLIWASVIGRLRRLHPATWNIPMTFVLKDDEYIIVKCKQLVVMLLRLFSLQKHDLKPPEARTTTAWQREASKDDHV